MVVTRRFHDAANVEPTTARHVVSSANSYLSFVAVRGNLICGGATVARMADIRLALYARAPHGYLQVIIPMR
jgi:hypothetical protein